MLNLYFSSKRDDGTRLYLAPLSSRRQAACVEKVEDPSGYFLFEERGSGALPEIEILARVDNDDAALRLSRLFQMT